MGREISYIEIMSRAKRSKNPVVEDAEAEASCHKEAHPKNQNKILEQLLPALVAVQQTQQQILQVLINALTNQAKQNSQAIEPVSDDSV